MRRSGRVERPGDRRHSFAACLAGILVGVVPIGPALGDHATFSNPDAKLGYSACVWPTGKLIRLRVSQEFPFPSLDFTARIDDAIARWNEVLASSGRQLSIVRSSAPESEIVFEYRAVSHDSAVLAETFLRRQNELQESPDINLCPARSEPAKTMAGARIVVSPRDDWWVGPDSAVASWGQCQGQAFRMANGSLCADMVDFGSTAAHELGHTLVLYHPESLDELDDIPPERPDSASTAAGCVESSQDFAAQATMCAVQGAYRADQRTLEPWDVETAHRHNR